MIGIGWLESEKDRSYVNLFSYHVNGDLSIEITIDDNQRNPCQNADWAEDLFDALRKEEDVLQVSLLRNEASKEMILEYMLDAPFNNQDTTSFFVIYHKGVKRE